MEQRSPDSSTLVCCVTVEWLNSQNSVSRRTNFKTVTLRLIRNEFREIFMVLRNEKTNCKYRLKGISVHKKFMAEGKASISFSEQKMVLLIFNAPPTQLLAFLRTMFIKLSGDQGESKVGTRTQLLSSKPSTLQETSPVTLQEVNQVKKNVGCCSGTPPGTKKRALQGQETPRQGKKSRMSLPLGPSPLTQEQKEVLNAALSGKNVFFTGSAGTGKSYLLRRIIGALPPDVTVATASTGVAACHIGGVTLHSFAGIGSGEASVERCIELASRPQVQQAWRKCRHLIIDEISMVDGLYFEKLERVARVVRGNDRPFGGLQLILCGDFLQLPPVTREMDQKGARFCFQSPAWDRCVHISFDLNQVHRQSDPVFIEILQNVRIGRVTPEITAQLRATMDHKVESGGILATQLCSHMQDANLINSSRLNNLAGATRTFAATDSDPYSTKMLDQMTPVPSSLVLKVGAQVMLMKNINMADGMVNGARGVITSFDDRGLPVVQFCSKKEVTLKPEQWIIKMGSGALLSRKQIPLRLAWAFSIHKSQGLTLDCVEMSLARVFEAGQAYVALSRAKSLDTLRILDFDPKQVWANPDVLAFYKKFRRKLHQMQIVPLGRPRV